MSARRKMGTWVASALCAGVMLCSAAAHAGDAKTDLTKAGREHARGCRRWPSHLCHHGDVLCWGAKHRQQLGNNAVTPQRVPLRSF